MSDGLIDADAAARIIEVTPRELKKLVDNGNVKRQNGKYHPVQLFRDYIAYIKKDKLRTPTQVEIAMHLDMSERNVRDVLAGIGDKTHRAGDWWKQSTIDEIQLLYIRDLREKAAGRGGESQSELARARTDESLMKAAKLRLEYQREINLVVSAEDAAEVIIEWARQANMDYTQGINKLVSGIQNKYSIKVDSELVEEIVCPTTDRIKGHAEKLGSGLVERIDDIPEAEISANS